MDCELTNPTFDVRYNVPRPEGMQPSLHPSLETRGWWISDNTMRTLAEMATIWFSDICSNECKNCESLSDCPYGETYAQACNIARRIVETVKETEGPK